MLMLFKTTELKLLHQTEHFLYRKDTDASLPNYELFRKFEIMEFMQTFPA
jgi:hypothetical protein